MDARGTPGGSWSRLSAPIQRLLREPGAVPAILTLGLAVASWPVADAPARPGLDPSFAAALGYAVIDGQRFGSDVLYTYGPLGVLGFGSPWHGPLTLLGLVFVGSVHLALCAVIALGALRLLPLPAAAIVAYPAARDLRGFLAFEGLLILVTCGAAAFLLGASDRGRRLAAPLGGLAIAIGLLGKLNAGVFIAGIVFVAVIADSRLRWRSALLLVGWSAAWLASLWLLTGHGPGDVPGYIRGSFELISGFSQAMGIDPGPGQAWAPLAYVVEIVLLAALVIRESVGLPGTHRLALALVGGLAAFAFYKTGFVRWHVTYALALPVVVLFALASRRIGRLAFIASWMAVMTPAIAIWGDPLGFLNPTSSVRSIWHQAQVVGRPWTWDAAAQRTRAQLQAAYALEPEIVAALRGETVHVDPIETGVVVAWPELAWRPLPVFQSYTAYTPWLDERNAEVLRGARAPTRILRGGPPIGGLAATPRHVALDGRFEWWESPAATLEMFCRYDEVAATSRWEVLALGTRRCGLPEPLQTVTARTGEPVPVPDEARPDRMVIVRVRGIEDGILDRIVTALYRSPEWWATLDDGRSFRLVPGTAVDGLLLAVPASITRSPDFAFGAPIRQLSIEPRDRPWGPTALTYEFLSVPLAGS